MPLLRLQAATYSVRDLGIYTDLPGRADSRPNAINSSGRIAAANVTNGAYRAWLYAVARTNLGTLGGNESLASGINDSSRVVGYSVNASGATRGFVWTLGATDGVGSNPQMKALGTFGGAQSAAFAINTSGQIAGYAQTSKADHAFRYSGGTMTDLGALLPNGLPNSYAFAINDAGRVAGTAYSGNFNSWEAFFYDGSVMIQLGTFGGSFSSALAVNNSDCIVGYYTTSSGFDRAFRCVGGSMTDLGTLGGNYSYANAVNNSNVIVGGSFIDADDTLFRAFICLSNSMINLGTQLDATGAGWTLVEARGINDGGWIVGTGTYGGATHGFLLVPSTPPQITQQPTNLTVTCASSALFTVTALPADAVCRWFKGNPPTGAPIANATNGVLVLTNVNAVHAGGYYAVVSNTSGSATSAVAILTVIDTTTPAITKVKLAGTNALISFTTMPSRSYALEASRTLAAGGWSNLLASIPGTGGIVTVTNAGAATLSSRFYRVRLILP